MPDDESTSQPDPPDPTADEPATPSGDASSTPGTGDASSTPGAGDAPGDASSTPGTGDASVEPTAAPPSPGGRRRWGRAVALAGAACAAVAVLALVIAKRPHATRPGEPSPTHVGGAAIRAPEGPKLAGAAATGVRLTGVVVDGAGLPVVGAEVSAELERGAPDRALAPAPRPGSGNGAAGSGSTAGSDSTPGVTNGGSTAGSGSAPGITSSSGLAGSGSTADVTRSGGAARMPGSGSAARAAGSGAGMTASGSTADVTRSGGAARMPGSGGVAGSGSGAGVPGSGGPAGDGAVDPGVPLVITAPLTGADGRFVVEGLVPGRFRLHVTGAGLLPAELRYVPVPSDEARIVVARQVAIEGTVTDGGKPVANALVGLRGDAIGGTIETRANATGGFSFTSLPEGRYQLFAWQAALAARTVRVARLGAGPFGPVELRLEAAAIVVGRVIDREEGTGLVAAIELRPSGDDQAPRYARSGDDGVFRIEGVPNGRWIVDAFVPGYLSPGGVELAAGRGIPEIALTRGGAIEGRVLDGDGHPVAGATVRSLTAGQNPTEVSAEVDRDKLRRFSGRTAAPVPVSPGALGGDPDLVARGELGVMVGPIPPIPPPGAHVAQTAVAIDPSLAGEPPALPADPARVSIWTTAADGVYRIRGFSNSKVTVLATAIGFAEARSKQVVVAPGQLISHIDLVLTPGTLIVGKVTDQHATPVIGAQVTATSVGAGSHDALGATLDAFTDEAGEYKLGPVTGTVELHASAYGHGEARRTIDLVPVPGAAPGERREDLLLAVADATVAGILEDATGATVAGAHIDVVGGVGDGRHAIVDANGTFSIDMLPAGPLRLHIEHPAYPPDDVDVVASVATQARARLRLALGGGVEGALLDAASGAPIASVTLVASGPANALAEASTDKAGRWKLGPLKPGRWTITIKLPGYLAQVHALDVPVAHIPGGTSVRDLRIELARGSLLGGTVRDARGQRLGGAHVIATARSGAGPTCEADTDGQGEFRIRDCPTGDLDVVATKATGRGGTRTTVRPGDEVLGLALELR